jgi:phage protein D
MSDPQFYSARPQVRWANRDDPRFAAALLELTVIQPAEGMDRLEMRLVDLGELDGTRPFAFDDLKLGDTVTVAMGATTGQTTVFSGECTALECILGQGAPQATILAEDKLHRLAKARHSRVFADMSLDDVVRQVAADHGLSSDSACPTHGTWHQLGESDLAFLRRLLAIHEVAPRLVDGVLTARHPDPPAEHIALDARSNASHVRLTTDLAQQPGLMRGDGYDVAQGQVVTAQASRMEPTPDGTSAIDELNRLSWSADDQALQPAVLSQAQGEAQAKAKLVRRGGQFVSGDLTSDGDPRLQPGAAVTLAGVPPRFAGAYGVASCIHRYDLTHGYRTLVRLARGGLA